MLAECCDPQGIPSCYWSGFLFIAIKGLISRYLIQRDTIQDKKIVLCYLHLLMIAL